jgi:hypothetical protein
MVIEKHQLKKGVKKVTQIKVQTKIRAKNSNQSKSIKIKWGVIRNYPLTLFFTQKNIAPFNRFNSQKMKMKTNLKDKLGNGAPNDPEKHIPVKPDKDPDPTKKKNDDPKKIDPTRINEPEKNDPTRIDEPPPDKPKQIIDWF